MAGIFSAPIPVDKFWDALADFISKAQHAAKEWDKPGEEGEDVLAYVQDLKQGWLGATEYYSQEQNRSIGNTIVAITDSIETCAFEVPGKSVRGFSKAVLTFKMSSNAREAIERRREMQKIFKRVIALADKMKVWRSGNEAAEIESEVAAELQKPGFVSDTSDQEEVAEALKELAKEEAIA